MDRDPNPRPIPGPTHRPTPGPTHRPTPGPTHRWSDAGDALRSLASDDLDAGVTPVPTLTGFAGDHAVALVGLRPFERGEVVQALVEVLALLLPLDVDRLALSLPGRAWSLDDPIVPVADDLDLRAPVLLVVTADGRDGPCRTEVEVHPIAFGPDGWRWEEPVRPDGEPVSPVDHALRVLLDGRETLRARDDGTRVIAQFGRVLLLGHEVVLAPATARRLELATTV